MDDLISRRQLKAAMYHEAFEKDSDLQKWDSGCWIRYKLFEKVTDSLPSELVRCKDCKWFGKVGCAVMIADDYDKPTENDYCSFAERRD